MPPLARRTLLAIAAAALAACENEPTAPTMPGWPAEAVVAAATLA